MSGELSLKSFMKLKKTDQIDIKKEALAGITTFFTMAYIIVVNPAILATPGTGMEFNGVLTATVLLAFSMTLFMGLYAKLPYGVAPGMGINAFFTYSVVLGKNVPWQTALGAVFWSGVLFVLISATPLREGIAKAIPPNLRTAAAAGIGLFLTFIGFKNAGIVASDSETFVRFGGLSFSLLVCMAGIALALFLMTRKSPLAFLAGIGGSTILAWFCGDVKVPQDLFAWPDFSTVFMKLDLWGSLKLAMLPTILSFFATDLFDSISTFVGVSQATGLTDDQGNPKNLKQGLIVDSFATAFAGAFGTSSGTAYIESAAGIEMGGRTGLTAVFTALCFLPCFFIAPIAGMVPAYATASVLILVGALMFRSITKIRFERLEDLVPSFLTIVMIPLTFSITQGILWGFILHVTAYTLAGRSREIKAQMWVIAVFAIGLLVLDHFS